MRGIWAITGLFFIALFTCNWAAKSPGLRQNLNAQDQLSSLEQHLKTIKSEAMASKGTGAPALWKLSDIDTDIYLFGTLHNLADDTKWMSKELHSALSLADEIYMEVELSSKQARKAIDMYQQENGFLPAGDSLFKHMDTGDAYRLRQSLKSIGEDPQQFDHLQPWLAAIQISQIRIKNAGYDASNGVETFLTTFATEKQKPIRYLENIESQMILWDNGNFDDQINSLAAMSRTLTQPITEMELVAQEWLDGDIHGLGLLVSNPHFGSSKDPYIKRIKKRNEAWAPKILEQLEKPGVIFVAVGAAHLAGPDSVISIIEQNSKAVERIQ